MAMHDLKWSASEKKIARRAYEAALESTLAEIMTEFKALLAASFSLCPAHWRRSSG